MKKLLILLFSILISFNSYGEWKLVATDVAGNDTYIETDTIKEHGGYVYFWDMMDLLKPSESGTISSKMYLQVDCGINRYKVLTFLSYKESMGKGEINTSYNPPNEQWEYPAPNSTADLELNFICDYVD